MNPIERKISKVIEKHLGDMLELNFLDIDKATCNMNYESVSLEIITGSKARRYAVTVTEIKEEGNEELGKG